MRSAAPCLPRQPLPSMLVSGFLIYWLAMGQHVQRLAASVPAAEKGSDVTANRDSLPASVPADRGGKGESSAGPDGSKLMEIRMLVAMSDNTTPSEELIDIDGNRVKVSKRAWLDLKSFGKPTLLLPIGPVGDDGRSDCSARFMIDERTANAINQANSDMNKAWGNKDLRSEYPQSKTLHSKMVAVIDHRVVSNPIFYAGEANVPLGRMPLKDAKELAERMKGATPSATISSTASADNPPAGAVSKQNRLEAADDAVDQALLAIAKHRVDDDINIRVDQVILEKMKGDLQRRQRASATPQEIANATSDVALAESRLAHAKSDHQQAVLQYNRLEAEIARKHAGGKISGSMMSQLLGILFSPQEQAIQEAGDRAQLDLAKHRAEDLTAIKVEEKTRDTCMADLKRKTSAGASQQEIQIAQLNVQIEEARIEYAKSMHEEAVLQYKFLQIQFEAKYPHAKGGPTSAPAEPHIEPKP